MTYRCFYCGAPVTARCVLASGYDPHTGAFTLIALCRDHVDNHIHLVSTAAMGPERRPDGSDT